MQARSTESFAPPVASIDRGRQRAWIVGGVAALATLVGFFVDRDRFYQSYLVAWVYTISIPLGCLALLMLHHITKGAWGVVIRRILESGAITLPLLLVLFLPVVFGMKTLYPWTDPELIAHDSVVAGKSAYLNQGGFLLRVLLYFVFWSGLALVLRRLSRRQDGDGDPQLALRMQGLSGFGVLLYVVSASFAAIDWLMSLDPHWFSSIYGIWFVGANNLAALAFVVPVAATLAGKSPLQGVLRRSHFRDYGRLMLAFTMLWAYFSLSQFLIIWSGNMPEDIPWYMARTTGKWTLVSQALVFAHFALPFLLLLSTDLKRDRRRLGLVALLILVMRWVDIYWQAAPAMGVQGLHWLDLTSVLALGGLWFGAFLTVLKRAPLLPVQDPFLEEALSHA